MERIKPRSYDILKGTIRNMTTEAKKAFPEGKYWLTLVENGGCVAVDNMDIRREDGTIYTRAVLICRDQGKITENVDTYDSFRLCVLESEIPDVVQIMREDGNLFLREEGNEEDAGNLGYWYFFEEGIELLC